MSDSWHKPHLNSKLLAIDSREDVETAIVMNYGCVTATQDDLSIPTRNETKFILINEPKYLRPIYKRNDINLYPFSQ